MKLFFTEICLFFLNLLCISYILYIYKFIYLYNRFNVQNLLSLCIQIQQRDKDKNARPYDSRKEDEELLSSSEELYCRFIGNPLKTGGNVGFTGTGNIGFIGTGNL